MGGEEGSAKQTTAHYSNITAAKAVDREFTYIVFLPLWREGLRAVLLRSRENLRAVLLELCKCTAPWTPQPPAEERERSLLWLLLLCVPPVVVVGSLGVESACAMA